MTITLPWPPSVNTYYRHVGPKVLISRAGREYRVNVAAAVVEQQARRVDGRLAMKIVALPPDRRRRDLDNLGKAALDAMCHAGLYDDDSQIDDLHIVRGDVIEDGALVVTVENLTQRGNDELHDDKTL